MPQNAVILVFRTQNIRFLGILLGSISVRRSANFHPMIMTRVSEIIFFYWRIYFSWYWIELCRLMRAICDKSGKVQKSGFLEKFSWSTSKVGRACRSFNMNVTCSEKYSTWLKHAFGYPRRMCVFKIDCFPWPGSWLKTPKMWFSRFQSTSRSWEAVKFALSHASTVSESMF